MPKKPKEQDQFHIDEPANSVTHSGDLVISGWYLATGTSTVKRLRAKLNETVIPLKFNTKRPDVAASFPDRKGALRSGFYKRLPYEGNGLFVIEVDKGSGFKPFYTTKLEQDTEVLASMTYNPDLSTRYADHLNVLEARKQYFYESEAKASFELGKADPRLVAFYLGQFHPIPENDRAWGKGFTEWRNVTTAQPRFIGHEQPFLPQDLGFYDLRLDSVIADQIALAKKYGIYGFCFYYYWFSGKILLDKPLETFLSHKEWDFNFSICWANENWTKRWDGRDDEIIVAQKYQKDDALKFIKDVEHILTDSRYIRENGKPVLAVYRIMKLKHPASYVKVWREYMRSKHGLELYLVAVLSTDMDDPRQYGFDIALDFVPSTVHVKEKTLKLADRFGVDVRSKLLDINFKGIVGDYRKVVLSNKMYPFFDFPTIKSIMPSWDNEARKKGGGFAAVHTSPDLYGHWLKSILSAETRDRPDPLVFINAWNEWAEGTVLEPTMHQGHALLRRTAEVLALFSHNKNNINEWPQFNYPPRRLSTKLAVVVHIYGEDGWSLIERKLKVLQAPYDLFITTTLKNQYLTRSIAETLPDAHITIVPNRGRDVLPFLHTTRRLHELGYEYVLKLHTQQALIADTSVKKQKRNLPEMLLPNARITEMAVHELASGVSFIGPKTLHVALTDHIQAGSSPQFEHVLIGLIGERQARQVLSNPAKYKVFLGSMFWARLDALRPLLDLYLEPEDFEAEEGQEGETMARAIERLFGLIPTLNGGKIYQISAAGVLPQKGNSDTD